MNTTDKLITLFDDAKPYQSEYGSVSRQIYAGGDRYQFDFNDELRKEWKQYDTDRDASYFGVWVNVSRRMVLTFAEGDLILTTCDDADIFRADLDHMADFYGEAPPAVVVLSQDGTRTDIYDARPNSDDVK